MLHSLPQSTALYVITQLFSIAGMLFNCLSYQQKKKSRIIFLQLLGGALFTVHYFLLNAPLGFLMNAIGFVRACVFCRKERIEGRDRLWVPMFILCYIASYVLAFTVLGIEPTAQNLLSEVLPVLAMTLCTLAFAVPTARGVRRLLFAASPLWLTYNIFSHSIGGMIGESINLCSNTIAMLRHDRAKKEDDT